MFASTQKSVSTIASLSSNGDSTSPKAGKNFVGEDLEAMLKSYSGPLPIHPRWYELPSGICRSGDLSKAPILARNMMLTIFLACISRKCA